MVAVGSARVSIARSRLILLVAGLIAGVGPTAAGAAPKLPEIRLSRQNAVPVCVTPERLMAFLKQRNGNLSPRFRDIAAHYKRHGEAWGVRWDYAFFQMAIETNFLTYRAPSGRMGDVDPKQNNFAGIGTTGGGVPGDSFPDVSTGVLGQIQHLVVYSGEMVPNPVAPRTQLKQEHILEKSRELARPVRFSDLAKRWAADPKYGGSIEWVAERFRAEYCARGTPQQPAPQEIEMLPWQQKPPAGAEGRERASAPTPPATTENSPVRTVWSRDQEGAREVAQGPAKALARATQPAKKVAVSEVKVRPVKPVKPLALAATANVSGPIAPSAPDANTVSPASASGGHSGAQDPVAGLLQRHDVSGGEASSGTSASEPESSFALFTPPAALASATLPEVSRGAAAEAPKVEALPPPAAKPSPRQESRELSGPPAPSARYVAATDARPPAQLPSDQATSSDQATADQVGPAADKSEPETPGPLASLLGAGRAAPKPDFDPPSGLGVKPTRCVVETARYGGETTVLVKTPQGAKVHYVALSVIDGFEDSMTKSFLSSRGEGGEVLGTFPSREQALSQARTLCPAE